MGQNRLAVGNDNPLRLSRSAVSSSMAIAAAGRGTAAGNDNLASGAQVGQPTPVMTFTTRATAMRCGRCTSSRSRPPPAGGTLVRDPGGFHLDRDVERPTSASATWAANAPSDRIEGSTRPISRGPERGSGWRAAPANASW